MRVINLFGAPGAGKSTLAAELFAIMKREQQNVELVTEYAKDLVWAERYQMLYEQAYIFAKQNHRLNRLIGKVDYAITDSPLLLSSTYVDVMSTDKFPAAIFKEFVVAMHNTYDNINFFINRTHDYDSVGRTQNETESDEIADKTKAMLRELNVPFYEIHSSQGISEIRLVLNLLT